jgi:hypothetical protein
MIDHVDLDRALAKFENKPTLPTLDGKHNQRSIRIRKRSKCPFRKFYINLENRIHNLRTARSERLHGTRVPFTCYPPLTIVNRFQKATSAQQQRQTITSSGMFNQEKHIAQSSQSNFTFTKKGISTSSQAVSSATSQVIILLYSPVNGSRPGGNRTNHGRQKVPFQYLSCTSVSLHIIITRYKILLHSSRSGHENRTPILLSSNPYKPDA